MNQIIYYKVLKLFLIAVFTKIGFGSTTQNNTKLIVIAISEPYAINPFKDNLFYLQSGISFKSLSETEGYKYLPDFGFGYKISKNLSIEGSIFNRLSHSSPEQIIRGGVQYFFGTTDTLDWSCAIKKVNYRSVKNFDINSVTLDISRWTKYKKNYFRFGLGSSFYKNNNYINTKEGQMNFVFLDIIIPISILDIALGSNINPGFFSYSIHLTKDFY